MAQQDPSTATDLEDGLFFDGRDVRVVLRLFERDPDLFITFTGRAANPPVPHGFGETFFRKRGLSAVHFISKANHWWQTPEVGEAIAALRAAGILAGKRQITLYGSSMGGYASMMHSAELRPSQILAVSPQYSIDGKVVPFEWRWRNYAAKLTFDYDDMDRGLDREARLLVVVDTFFRSDALHLRLVETHRSVEVVRISFAGHNTARALEEIGLATRLVTEVAQGRFDNLSFCRDYRRRRPGSSLFWYGLGAYLTERGRRGWALASVALAAHLMLSGSRMRDPTLQRDILELAMELAGEARLGVSVSPWLKAFEAHSPVPRMLAKLRAQAAMAMGRAPEAMEHVRELLRLGAEEDDYAVVIAVLDANNRHRKAEGILARAATSNSAPLVVAAGGSLLANGKAEAALPILARAAALDRHSGDARILLAAAHLETDDEESAREALRDAAGAIPASPAVATRLVATTAALEGEAAAQRIQVRVDRMRAAQAALLRGIGEIDPAEVGEGIRALIRRLKDG